MDVFLPKGTRDLLPDQMALRLDVIATLREVFGRFGFDPLETPAFERLETLVGKYGDEGEKLMYRILRRGEGGERGEVDLALRYDLTVPLARVMAMHTELRLPFRRYQIQPVWRADRPQKGRFREFWQCDADICGTSSHVADAECVALFDTALSELGFQTFRIRLNDRRLLRSLARQAGAETVDRESQVLVALDKLDKIGRPGVDGELRGRGFEPDGIARLWAALDAGIGQAPEAMRDAVDEEGQRGLAAIRQVLDGALALGVPADRVKFDPTLARGLDYYTGPVFETEVDEPKVGSLGGGGRYDDLIGMFANKPIPAVGMSLGLERIILVLEELGWRKKTAAVPDVLVAVYGPETQAPTLAAASALRRAGIRTEVYADEAKLGRQLKHANARQYPWVVVVGPDERDRGVISLKNLRTGEQAQVTVDEAVARIRA